MAECRIVVEFREASEDRPTMRWEHAAEAKASEAFALLGKAFDISRHESPVDFHQALAAFLRGAMIQKEDLAEFLAHFDGEKSAGGN